MFDVISVGSSLRDMSFVTDQLQMIDNPDSNPLREKLLTIEQGAKIQSDEVHFGFGGGGGNSAMNFAKLGVRTAIISCVGDDVDGDIMKRQYTQTGIETRFLQRTTTARTGFSFIAVSEQTHDRTVFVHYGAAKELEVRSTDLQAVTTQWYYISSINSKTWQKTLQTIMASGAQIAWNPGGLQLQAPVSTLKRLLKQTTVLLVNADEATELLVRLGKKSREYSLEELVSSLIMFGPQIVVVTNGKEGSIVQRDDEIVYQAAPNDKPVDVSGAGDCFGSSFVTGLIRYDGDIVRSLDLAQTVVNGLIKKVGAQNGLTTWERLPKRLRDI